MKKVILFLVGLVMLSLNHANAQRNQKIQNLPNFDKKKVHFGFSLGVNTMDFMLEKDLTTVDTLLAINRNPQSGFNIGIVSAVHFNKNFSLRFLPALSFGQRDLEYVFRETGRNSIVVKQVESTYIEFPLNFKFRSNRYNNFAAYMLFGGKYSLDLASDENTDNDVREIDQLVRLKRDSYSMEVGFGMDFFLEYFKFSPEIKLGIGMTDVLIQEPTIWTSPLNKIRPRMILISLNFEG